MSKNHKNGPKPQDPPLTTGQHLRVLAFLGRGLVAAFPWYVKLAVLVLPLAAWLAYPYYQQWSVMQEEFYTHAYNVSNENIDMIHSMPMNLRSTYIVCVGAKINRDCLHGSKSYVSQRKVVLMWGFETTNMGRTPIEKLPDRTCYFKELLLPTRLPGQNDLLVGIYEMSVLRVRWGNLREISKNAGANDQEAWKFGHIPLPKNWLQSSSDGWPLPPIWNEATEGSDIDARGNGQWLTLKADYTKPCEESE